MERDRHSKVRWRQLLRRTAAFFLAAVALWGVFLAAGMGKSLMQWAGRDTALVSALLRAELGPPPGDGLSAWDRLALGSSPLLLSNPLPQAADDNDPSAPRETPSAASPAPSATPGLSAEEQEDPQQLPAVTSAPDDIVARTLTPASTDGYTVAGGVYIFNRTSLPLDAAVLAAAPVTLSLDQSQAPQILIMHTHATEAYTPDGTDVYVQTDNSRTLDTDCNMCRIGREMAAVFEEMGLSVIHDETLYDYPHYSGAYSRSREGVEGYLERYPSIQLVLDVHRDALIGEDGTVYKAVTTIDGEPTAQVLMILGSPENGEHPRWMENMALAMKIQKNLDALYPTLARPITLRSSAYNQDLTTGSLLVEVGCHGNTLQESIRGGRLFARCAGEVLLELAQGE